MFQRDLLWIVHLSKYSKHIMFLWLLFMFLNAQSILAFAPIAAYHRRNSVLTRAHGGVLCPKPTTSSEGEDLRLLVLVEPSPFTYVCGYSNRFQELFRYLQQRRDGHQDSAGSTEVEIVTVEVVEDPTKIPHSKFGFPIHYTRGFRCWFYKRMSLSWDWTYQVLRRIWTFRPSLIHVTSPGFFIVPSLCYARLFQIPTVFSYHTHVPAYIPSYLPSRLAQTAISAVWWWIRFTHSLADLTLVTSNAIQKEFQAQGIKNVKVWQKGIDADRFHPRHYSEAMRRRMISQLHRRIIKVPHQKKTTPGAKDIALSQAAGEYTSSDGRFYGEPVSPLLLLYVGRLAAEKRIEKVRAVLENTPNSCLCIVGTGPHEDFLQNYFANTSTVFLGVLEGVELSQAYASADIFVFPSDSETLGFVVLEAMASELPVVTANKGGLPDIIEANATTGLLADCDEDYIRFVRQLGEDVELRKRVASAGRRATEQWTWYVSMAQVCEVHYETAKRNFEQSWRARFIRTLKRGLYNLRSSFGTGFTASQ